MRSTLVLTLASLSLLETAIGFGWFRGWERQKFPSPASTCWLKKKGTPLYSASARDDSAADDDQNDVIKEENRRNLIWGSAALLASVLGGAPSSSEAAFLEESEKRRIAIFETNAPSVVFIDTFTEKQDQFSPNIMEVPLGSGSGFVWDKQGHIGTSRFLSTTYHRVVVAGSTWETHNSIIYYFVFILL
jgi:hypothetical protein